MIRTIDQLKQNKTEIPKGMILKGYSTNGDAVYGNIVSPNTPFNMKVEGVFQFKSQPIITGCIETGEIHLGSSIYLLDEKHCVQTYVCGIEMFRKMWTVAEYGDSIGLLLPNNNLDWLHEGILATTDAALYNEKIEQQLTEDERDYLEAYKDACEDGKVSDKQRRLLEKLRVMYGISEARAKLLENM